MSSSGGWEATEIPDPDGVARRIAELGNGLTIDLLIGAIRVGQQAGDFCTPAHPVYGPGQMVHIETNGTLRYQLMLRGWTIDNEMNVPRIVSPDATLILTAVSGDDLTGLPKTNGRHAQRKSPCGSGGRRLINRNAQPEWTELLPPNDPALRDAPPNGSMWYLMYYRVPGTDVVRAELSLAESVGEDGALINWFERLPLPEFNMADPSPDGERGDDEGPDVDVPVERRSG